MIREQVGYEYRLCNNAFSVGSRSAVDDLTARLEADSCPARINGDGYYESTVLYIEGSVIEFTE